MPSSSSTPRSRSPREQLIRTVEEAIQSAYRRVGGDEDIHVRIDAETGKIRVFRARTRRRRGRGPADRVHASTEAHEHDAERQAGRPRRDRAARPGRVRADPRPDGQAGRPAAAPRGRARRGLRPVREPRGRDDHRHASTGSSRARSSSTSARTSRRSSPPPSSRRSSTTASARTSRPTCSRSGAPRAGPQIYVSRTHKGFLRRLFELEVPEIHAGTVEIKAIAREAGSRSKVAVAVAPGGPRPRRRDGRPARRARPGGRGRAGGEKIDVIPWNDDPAVFVANALWPAQVIGVDIDEEHRIANVTVPERMLSLAIGREGQNARLAARLTGWRIDIRSDVSVAEARAAPAGRAPRRRRPPPARVRPSRRRRRADAGAGPVKRAGEADGGAPRRPPAAAATEAAANRPPKPRRGPRRRTAEAPAKPAASHEGADRGGRPPRPRPQRPPTTASTPRRRRPRRPQSRGRPRRARPGGVLVGAPAAGRPRRAASRREPASRCRTSPTQARARPRSSGRRTAGSSSIRPARLAGRGAYLCADGRAGRPP